MKKNQKKLIAFATALTLIGSVSGQIPGEYYNEITSIVHAKEDVEFQFADPYDEDTAFMCKQNFNIHKSEDETEEIEIFDDAVYTFSNGKLTISGKNSKGKDCTGCIASSRVYTESKDLVTSIEVGEGIEYLGFNCFSGFNNVKSISLPSTLKVIGGCAINTMNSLESVNIPDSVVEIQGLALSNLPKIEEISIPSSVKYFGYNVIQNDDSLIKVSVNGSGASVGKRFIGYNDNLEEIYFGSGIKFIESVTVSDCPKVKKITIESSDTSIVDSAFQALGSYEEIDLSLPNSVISIDDYAFQNRIIKNLNVPETKTIGKSAFQYCSADNLTINGADIINESAFGNIKVKDSFSIKNVKEISEYAFNYAEIEDIDLSSCNGISIGDYAFSENNKLEHLTLPSSFGTLGEFIFSKCSSLETVDYSLGISNFKKIPDYMFNGCSSLKSFYNSTTFKTTTSEDARNNTIIIPSGVKTIGQYAFSSCKAIENVSFPDSFEIIEIGAFSGDENISEIELPSTTMSIGEYAFAGCTKLKGITIPKSVTEIRNKAFDRCSSLTIYGYTGSYAETYANKNNIPFVDINKKGDTTTTETTVTEAPTTTAVSEVTTAATTKATSATSQAVTTAATTKATSSTSKAVTTAATTKATSSTSKAVTTAATTKATSSTSKAVTTAATTKATSSTSKALTTAATAASSPITSASIIDTEILYVGDLDGNGVVELTDLTRLSVGLMNKTFNIKNNPQADIDGNGEIDIADLARFKQYISKDPAVKELGIVTKK